MDVAAYLVTLPPSIRTELLSHPHCALAIFKNLSEEDRIVILRLIGSPLLLSSLPKSGRLGLSIAEQNIPTTIPNDLEERGTSWNTHTVTMTTSSSIEKNTKSDLTANNHQALVPIGNHDIQSTENVLFKLELLRVQHGYLVLEDSFRCVLYQAFQVTTTHEIPQNATDTPSPPEAHIIEEFCRKQWEALVQPLLDLKSSTPIINVDTTVKTTPFSQWHCYMYAGLIDSTQNTPTPLGYQFILSDIGSQVWHLTRHWMEHGLAPSERVDAISLLIHFTTNSNTGKFQALSNLPKYNKNWLLAWEQLGLLKITDKWYLITPLATQMIEPHKSTTTRGYHHLGEWFNGFIVESNFYLYAYTNSATVMSITQLFAEVTVRLPNLCIARITRQSVRAAFRLGIRAHHIINYLQSNRHPIYDRDDFPGNKGKHNNFIGTMLQPNIGLATEFSDVIDNGYDNDETARMLSHQTPYTNTNFCVSVQDQLLLWEAEIFRFEAHPAFLWEFDSCDHIDLYQRIKKFAIDIGILLWFEDEQKCLCVKDPGHYDLFNFYQGLHAELD